MDKFIVYKLDNGACFQVVECQAEFMRVDEATEGYIPYVDGFDSMKHYVYKGKLSHRPEPAYVLEGMHLKGVPEGADVIIEGKLYKADGSDIELEFSATGTYVVNVYNFPTLDWSATVEDQA